MPEGKLTTIKLSKATKDRLADFGKKSETFDVIVNRMLNEVEEARKKVASRIVS
jgi:hypothetical protein